MKQNLKPIQTVSELRAIEAEVLDQFAWPQPALALCIAKEKEGDRRFAVLQLELNPAARRFTVIKVIERTHHRDLAQEAVGKAARNLYPRAKT